MSVKTKKTVKTVIEPVLEKEVKAAKKEAEKIDAAKKGAEVETAKKEAAKKAEKAVEIGRAHV